MVCSLKKSRAYHYRDLSILTLLNFNTNTYYMAKKCFLYEGAKLWNSISNGIKTIENIHNLKRYLKNGMDLLTYVKIVPFAR